jgi:hypothetical protein
LYVVVNELFLLNTCCLTMFATLFDDVFTLRVDVVFAMLVDGIYMSCLNKCIVLFDVCFHILFTFTIVQRCVCLLKTSNIFHSCYYLLDFFIC